MTYTRSVDKPTGKVYIIPAGTQVPTEAVPAAGLTADGSWVPLLVGPDGTLFVETNGMSGTPHYDDAEAEVNPGVEQTLVDQTVPSGIVRSVSAVRVVTRVTGSFAVMANGEMIGSGRTGPGEDGRMLFSPPRPLTAGTEYEVLFTSRLNAPAQGVECYVQASDVSTGG